MKRYTSTIECTMAMPLVATLLAYLRTSTHIWLTCELYTLPKACLVRQGHSCYLKWIHKHVSLGSSDVYLLFFGFVCHDKCLDRSWLCWSDEQYQVWARQVHASLIFCILYVLRIMYLPDVRWCNTTFAHIHDWQMRIPIWFPLLKICLYHDTMPLISWNQVYYYTS